MRRAQICKIYGKMITYGSHDSWNKNEQIWAHLKYDISYRQKPNEILSTAVQNSNTSFC